MRSLNSYLFGPLAPFVSAAFVVSGVFLFSDSITMSCQQPKVVDFVRQYVVTAPVDMLNDGVDWAFTKMEADKPSVLQVNIQYSETATSFSKKSVCNSGGNLGQIASLFSVAK